uniref:Uncharacterized protein n=1 Tax=Tanacetum cinerariifolium TaxID=118510 RepID=A0A699HX13_TANCI|nr:hypothetical protein [Tanacetum cinerariifolium]
MIGVNNQRDSVSPPTLVAKPKKGKSQTETSTSPKSQGPEALGALSKKSKKPMSKKPPTKTKKETYNSLVRGLPSTLDDGTHKLQPLPESTATHPKESEGNKEPFDMDLTFTTLVEGTAKTTPRPEGSHGDKDSGETNHLLIWNNKTPLMLISQGLVLCTRRTRPSTLD